MELFSLFGSAAQNNKLVLQKLDKIDEKLEKLEGELGEVKGELGEVKGELRKVNRQIRDQEDKFRDFELAARVSNGYIPAQPLKGYPGSALIEREEDRVELGLFY